MPDPAAAAGSVLPRVAGFIVLELAFLGAVQWLGGPPWVALGVLACCGQILADFRAAALLLLGPAVGWAAAHHVSGDRELFFPYAMFLAAHVAGQFAARGRAAAALGGGGIVAAFLAVRVLQRAGPRVLAVEFVVAAAILGAVVAVRAAAVTRPGAATLVAVLASLAAFLGLAL